MIVSASCRTDIPAFYGAWFMRRVRAGSCTAGNPYGRPRSAEPVQPAFPANGRRGARTAADPRPEAALSRGRHRHRVDKSLSTRHSRPSNAGRECRHLPTRPAGRHCRRQMPTVRARRRGVGIFDPRVGMSRRCASRNPSVGGPLRVTAASVAMAVACMMVSSTWAGARPAAFLPFYRHARTCSGHPRPSATSPLPARTAMPQDVDARNKSIAVRFRWGGPGAGRWDRRVSGPSDGSGRGSRPARSAVLSPPLSPRT